MPELSLWVDDGPPFHRIKLGDMDLEVLLVALDRPRDIAKLLSMELTGAWVNEAREVPKPESTGCGGYTALAAVGRGPQGMGWRVRLECAARGTGGTRIRAGR